jgi:N-methylhydantoinase A
VPIEVLSWTLTLTTPKPAVDAGLSGSRVPASTAHPAPERTVSVYDRTMGTRVEASCYLRSTLPTGATIAGPALIVEPQTTTVVDSAFDAEVLGRGDLLLTKRSTQEGVQT